MFNKKPSSWGWMDEWLVGDTNEYPYLFKFYAFMDF